MKREFAKWILDIAKYMVTALLLSSVFSDLSGTVSFVAGIIGAMFCLAWGLWIFHEQDKKESKNNKKKRK